MDEVDGALFAAATKFVVHNGQKANFWRSCWINVLQPAILCPQLTTSSVCISQGVGGDSQTNNKMGVREQSRRAQDRAGHRWKQVCLRRCLSRREVTSTECTIDDSSIRLKPHNLGCND